MTNEPHTANSGSHGGFERRDVGIAGVLYFLLGLVAAGLIVYFAAKGVFSYLDKQTEAQQAPVSPMVTNAPRDTRRLPPEYNGNYRDYLNQNFPAPQLEIDERTQLNDIIIKQEQELSSYAWVDQQAGAVRIPIDRAMDLVAQRGLPVRAPATPQLAAGSRDKKDSKKMKGASQ
jgi:hypothetical protein